ncbi:hypothetical protein A8C56_13335 [Niabella ginsenosidivorans]|uniref:DUF4230 domain-containing protein n=1 Tax=Niabella ginsenosidivorans TaxID=1176587 RepID=A0A1A9I584_9BACT|nr:DUF4230 domain-containing protein [Niabella ginsenosidivorans]ANH81831.1 hypothetical protein A8C56_13335 [Niabella ginsenosidivorans]
MQKGCLPFIIVLCAVAIGVLAYLLGKKNGTKTIENIALNAAFVKEVSELASLEVQGTANIKTTNITNDGTMTDAFKKMFMERTVNISIPYIAKYGVSLEKQQVNIEEKNKVVHIVIPAPQLLSYELRMDRADAMTRRGMLESPDETYYATVQKKLYAESRKQMEGNPVYMQQSKDKIRKILEQYYAPMNFKVEVLFKDELKSRVVDQHY